MCYIDKTNYTSCASPTHHNTAREIDPEEFSASYPQYQYQPITPGYVPCQQVLEARFTAKICHDLYGPIHLRVTEPTPCPRCNFIRKEHGHQVTYRSGRLVEVAYLQEKQNLQTHRVHQPFVPYCPLCRKETGDRMIGGGPPARDTGFGYAPSGPPGREAYKSYTWGPNFK
ncbi:hypothetical protein E2P81_ATG05583 [Venturia nashicola]|nr:hypothetical protein E2P81_ATG05583 [Venturia nashicola]